MADKSAPKSVDLSQFLKPAPPAPPIKPAAPAPVAAQFREAPPAAAPQTSPVKSVDLSGFLTGKPTPPPPGPALMTPAGQVANVVKKGQATNRAIAAGATPPMTAAAATRAADTAALFSGSTAYRPSPAQIAADLPPPPPPETLSQAVRKSRERMLSDAGRSAQEAVGFTTKALTQAQRAAESGMNLDFGEALAKVAGAGGYGLGAAGMGFDALARGVLGATNIGPAVEAVYGKPLEEATAGLSPGVINLPRIPIPGLTQLRNVGQSIYESATDAPILPKIRGWSTIGGPVQYDLQIPREFPVEAGIQIGGMFPVGEMFRPPRSPAIPKNLEYNAKQFLAPEQIAREAADAAAAFQGGEGVFTPDLSALPTAATVEAGKKAARAAKASKTTEPPKEAETPPTAVPEATTAEPNRVGGVKLPDESISDKSDNHAEAFQRWEQEGFAARDRLEREEPRTPAPEPLTFSEQERAIIPGAIKEAEALVAKVTKAVAQGDARALIDAWAAISRRFEKAEDETDVTWQLFQRVDEHARAAAVHLQDRVAAAEQARLIKEMLDEEPAPEVPKPPEAPPAAERPPVSAEAQGAANTAWGNAVQAAEGLDAADPVRTTPPTKPVVKTYTAGVVRAGEVADRIDAAARAGDAEGLRQIAAELEDLPTAGRSMTDGSQISVLKDYLNKAMTHVAATGRGMGDAAGETLARPRAPVVDDLVERLRQSQGERPAQVEGGVVQPSPEPARTSDFYNRALAAWNEIGRRLDNLFGEGAPMPPTPERPRLAGMDKDHWVHGALDRIQKAIDDGDGQAVVNEAASASRVMADPKADVVERAAAATAMDYARQGMEHLQGRTIRERAGEFVHPSEAADLYTMSDLSRPKTVAEVQQQAARAEQAQAFPDTRTAPHDLDNGLAPPRQPSPEELARIINGTGFPGSRTPDPTTPIPPVPKAVKTPQELARDLADVVGVIVRRGRIRFRNALGVLNTRSHIIRMKEMADFDVVAHEVGHALEFKGKKTGEEFRGLRSFFAAYDSILSLFTYAGAPANLARVEGFAEWIRLYMTNPDLLRKYTAQAVADFETVMASSAPDVLQGLQRIQAEYDAYIKADPVSIGMSRVAEYPKQKGFAEKVGEAIRDPRRAMGELLDDFVYGYASNLNPLRKGVNSLLRVAEANIRKSGWHVQSRLRQLPQKVTENPFDLMEALPGAANRGLVDVNRGIVPYGEVAPVGMSFTEILAAAGDAVEAASSRIGRTISPDEWLNRFDSYLISRRMLKQWERHERGEIGRPDLLSKEQHQAIIDAEEAMFPEWRDVAQNLYEMQGRLWAKLRDAGIMSPALFEATTRDHPDYVPTLRDMTDVTEDMARDIENVTGMSAADALENLGKIAGFKGSQRNVLSPTRAIFEKIMSANLAIAKNDVHKALLNLSRLPGSGQLVEQIPRYTRNAINVSASEMAEKVAEIVGNTNLDAFTQGLVTQAVADADGMTVWRAVEDAKRGQFIIHAWEDGVRHDLRLPGGKEGKQIYDALTGMDRLTSQAWLNIVAIPGAALRTGVVMHPTFALTNLGRDMISTAALTNVGYLPGYDNARALIQELRQGDTATRYRIGMGIVGGERAAAVRAVRENNDILRLRKAGFRIVRPRTIGEALRMIPTFGEVLQKGAEAIELAETTTRLSVFDRAEQRALARGLTPYEAMMEASLEARRVIDFDARGANQFLQGLQIATPFLRANIQGMRSFLRVLSPTDLFGVLLHNLTVPKTAQIAMTEAQRLRLGKSLNLYRAMSLMAALEMTLRVVNQNNPVYDEMDDLRRENWVIPIGNRVMLLPKPFELALMGNLMSRFYEGVVMNDPSAGKEAWKDFVAVTAPPVVPQTAKMIFNIARNRDDFGNAIVPEGKRQRMPEDQYGDRTNPLAIEIAQGLAGVGIHWSPAVIDYVARNSGGYASRDIMNGIEAVMTPATREAFDATKFPVLQRFWKDPTRMATGSREFWDLARGFGGELTSQQQSFHAALQANDIDRAQQIYNRGDPWDRAYLIATAPGVSSDMKVFHPMVTMPKVVGALGDMTTLLSKGNVTGLDGQVIDLTPQQRRDAIDAIAWAGWSMKQNAKHDIGYKGQDERPAWPYRAYLQKVYEIDPRLYQHLDMMVASEAGVSLEMIPALRTTYRDTIAPIVNRRISREDLELLAGIKRESATTRKKLGERLREVSPP